MSHVTRMSSTDERAALAADPTLVFRRLPALELSAAEESAEIESVRRAVAAMRAGRRLERAAYAGSAGRQWSRYAAAAVLALAALSLGVDRRSDDLGRMAPGSGGLAGIGGFGASGARGAIGGVPALPGSARVPAGAILPAANLRASGEAAALLQEDEGASADSADGAMEGLNRPKARVYQLHGRHLQVVMIVDEKLDV
jgi:hypothetical protein